MNTITIFRYIRDPRDHSKIKGRLALRVVNVHPSFVGFGDKGAINKAEFKKLADDLEPTNDGISLS